jgi:hypothetical protein
MPIWGYHIQGSKIATLPWAWAPLPCPIATAVTAPMLPSVRARARIPRTTRARADLGGLRCADNLRCAPPTGPLEGVPFDNELRISMGEGPLIDDIDFGSSKTEKLLLSRLLDMTFGLIQASFHAPARASCSDRVRPNHTRNTSLDSITFNFHPVDALPVTEVTRIWPGRRFIAVRCAFPERVRANCAAPYLTRG